MKAVAKEERRVAYPLVLIFALLAAGIVTSCYFYHRNYERHFRAVAGRRLAARYGWRLGDAIVLKGTYFPGEYRLVLRAIYTGRDPSADETLLFFHWDYLNETLKKIAEINPALVFNLVESIDGQGRLIHLAPSILDAMNMAYTGAGTGVGHVHGIQYGRSQVNQPSLPINGLHEIKYQCRIDFGDFLQGLIEIIPVEKQQGLVGAGVPAGIDGPKHQAVFPREIGALEDNGIA